MNTDIRLSVEFWDHHKTIKLERRLGLEGIKSLLILWAWAAKNRVDGFLYNMDSEDIEIAARWKGKPGDFAAELINLKWLDDFGEPVSYDKGTARYALHNWQRRNSWAADFENRGDKSRFSKLAQTNREVYKRLSAQGITAITREEYDEILANERRTPSEAPANAERTQANR